MAKSYYFGVPAALAVALVAVLAAYGTASAASGSAVPVTDVTPDEGAKRIPVTTDVEAVFDRDMDPDSFDADTVKLIKKSGNKPPEAASITYDPQTRTVTLDPDRPHLHSGRSYMATIVGGQDGVRSASGETFGQSKVWSFTVR